MRIIQRLIISFIFVLLVLTADATHNRAGEITYVQIDQLTIRVTITTYTKTSSTAADRDSLELFWGDGSSEFIVRSNGRGFPIDNDIKINYYISEHTYPGRGRYTLSMMDPNRVANILNVNWPNSVNVPFYIETTFTLLNTQFQGFNNSAILLQEPIDFACAGHRFEHNPNAYDPDGDSLAYELITPLQDIMTQVPDYKFPDQVSPGPDNKISIDPFTGNFAWEVPQISGEYNIAIRINEYREGVLINSMIRDMQIFVKPCNNAPPVVESIDEICVVAGELIVIDVFVDDPDEGQLVKITATGGPFTFDLDPAELLDKNVYSQPKLQTKFIWQTSCDHISNRAYQVVLKGVDNFDDTTGLADLKTLKILVVGPPPQNLNANSDGSDIKLTWELPYDCEFTSDEYFQGFSIWRRIGSNQFPVDTCNPGLDSRGYEKLIFLTEENDGNQYFSFDRNPPKGVTLCYRVLAEFAKSTESGNPFNKVQSLASDEVCLQVSRDLPLLTHVSVEKTSQSEGEIRVEWVKPLTADLDTIKNPGPYRYQLLYTEDIAGQNFIPVPGADFTVQNFSDPITTLFNQNMLNTQTKGYSYKMAFYSENLAVALGESIPASSIYLDIIGKDRINELSWQFDVPWVNSNYTIYRQNTQTGEFDSISTTNTDMFTDFDVLNNQEYCYKVKAFGTYGIKDIIDPLINESQIKCAIPTDSIAPCPPDLSVSNICEKGIDPSTGSEIINTLSWSFDLEKCERIEDLSGYNIYYAEQEGSQFELVEEISSAEIDVFTHSPETGLAGCYAISSVDSSLNESSFSNIVCVDNCPVFELPNTFTPNDDGSNDFFKPIMNQFIERVDMQIYNRWGQKVFETTAPEINWDGKNFSGKELAEGVYYYTCRIFERRVTGINQNENVLTGFIELIRG